MNDNLPYHTPPISLAVTTYNRPFQMLYDAFHMALAHPAVSEVVIVDDCSTQHFEQIKAETEGLNALYSDKITLIRNAENLGMSRNKAHSIGLCKNDWVLVFDSDNGLFQETIDALCMVPDFKPDTIYAPCFAEPNFDFRKYSGQTFGIKDVADRIHEREMSVMLNCCNYLVNKQGYGRAYVHNAQIKESDTIWFNYLWLRSGGKIHVVPDMRYFHRVHNDSGWLQNAAQNTRDANRIKSMIVAAADGNL